MLHLIPLRLNTLRTCTQAPLRLTASIALLAATLFPAQLLISQVPPTAKLKTAAPAGKSAKAPASRTHSQAAPAVQPASAEIPSAPPAPIWPADKAPQPAHITWDSHGLKIDASNSSLQQVLHEVSTITGAKIEGFSKDQRIFGTYGPGPARDVLSRLLDGSGYNVLMIGGLGDSPPRHIVLSTAGPAGPQPQPSTQNRQNDEDVDVEADNPQPPEPEPPPPPPTPQETPQPTPIRNPFGVPMMPQNPQPMPPDQPEQQNIPPPQ